MGANVATVVCPLGPRVRSFVGRKDQAVLPPEGLLPDVNDSAENLIKLFEDKSIRANGLVALVGAHTTSQQRFVDTARALDPQDATPGVWDSLFYPQTLDPNSPARVFKFASDVKLSTNGRTVEEWNKFATVPNAQQLWNDEYAKEYVRLSLLGVNNINDMTECSKVLPPTTGTQFQAPDGDQIFKWAMGGFSNYGKQIGQLLDSGKPITNDTLSQMGINPNDALNGIPSGPGGQRPEGLPMQGQPQQGQNGLPGMSQGPQGQGQDGSPKPGQMPQGRPSRGGFSRPTDRPSRPGFQPRGEAVVKVTPPRPDVTGSPSSVEEGPKSSASISAVAPVPMEEVGILEQNPPLAVIPEDSPTDNSLLDGAPAQDGVAVSDPPLQIVPEASLPILPPKEPQAGLSPKKPVPVKDEVSFFS